MDRRNFLRLATGAATALIIGEVVPLNRVWSFPSKIVTGYHFDHIVADDYVDYVNVTQLMTPAMMEVLHKQFSLHHAAMMRQLEHDEGKIRFIYGRAS